MDNVGFKSWTESGSPQVNNQYGVWGLAQTGTVVLYDDGRLHPQPIVRGQVTVSGSSPIIAIRPVGNTPVGLVYSSKNGNSYTFNFMAASNKPVAVDWWIFDTTDAAMIDASMDNVGGRVYNTYQQKIFDASMYMMRPVYFTPNSASLTVPSGKSYAVVFSTIGSYQATLDTGNYSNSPQKPEITLPPDDGSGSIPGVAKWRQQEINYSMGMVSFDNGVVDMGMFRYENYTDWYPISQQPSEHTYGSPGFTIVDVTNFPGGGGSAPGAISVNVNATLREVSISGAGDSITPAVTLSVSGGSGSITEIEWIKKPGSSPSVVANGSNTNATFNTKVIGQAAGTVVEAIWYARVVKGGVTGYGPEVLFRHTTGAVDTTPDPITPMDRFNVSSNDPDVSWASSPRQITGINTPINLRFERYNYTGNLSALYIDVFSGPSATGPWTHHGYFTASDSGLKYLDISVANGTWIRYNAHAVTSSGRRSGSTTLTIWNLSAPGGSVKISDVNNNNFIVDSDDNYNVIDNTLNVPSLNNINLYTNDPSGYTDYSIFQTTGINVPVNLRFTRGGLSTTGNIIYGRTYIRHSTNGGASWNTYLLTAAAGEQVNITVNNGDYISIYGYAETSSGKATASWYVEITNTTANQYLGYLYAYTTVDADKNYNVTPLQVALTNPYSYYNEFVMPGQYYEIADFAGPVVSGGTPPYSYKWTRTGGLATPSTSTAMNPRFSYYAAANWQMYSSWQLEVTDAANNKVYGYFTADWAAGNVV